MAAQTKPKKKAPARKNGEEKAAASPYDALLRFALRFPETVEEYPWGETVIKVRARSFSSEQQHE